MASPQELLDGFGKAITGDKDIIGRVCAPDIEYWDSMTQTHGTAELAPYLQAWATAFPDATTTVTNIVESGDQAVGQMLYKGTHTGPLASPQGEIPATGKTVELHGAAWITIRDGKIAKFNGYYDTMTMMMQLGLVPAPATA
jgi:steroid delta-isomerase-like uncharacterized protein